MTTVEVLTKARELIARPGGWTQDVLARGNSGRPVNVFGKAAVCFCMSGALDFVEGEYDGTSEPRYFIRKATGQWTYTDWNDSPKRTQAEVIAAFDAAISLAAAAASADADEATDAGAGGGADG